MDRQTRRPALAAALVLALLGSACDSAPSMSPSDSATGASSVAPASPATAVPSFAPADCPANVADASVVQLQCGLLTVQENRAAPNGRTISLLVVRIDPRGAPAPDPMVVVADVRTGEFPDYGGLVEIANRVQRVVYILDPRGRAHSQPNLSCPEVVAASPTLVGLRWRDPIYADSLRSAVAACRDRLVAEGADLTAYGLDGLAGDFEDLVMTLDLGQWNAIAYGPASQLAFEIARRDQGHLRSVTVDSPTLPDRPWVDQGPAAFDLAIERLGAACAASPGCAAHSPHLAADVAKAVAMLDGNPQTFEVKDTPKAIQLGHPILTMVDGAAFLRWIRAQIGLQRPVAGGIVTAVQHVLGGKLGPSDPAVTALSGDVGGCLGTLPRCEFEIAWGSIYSAICGRSMSVQAAAALGAEIAGRPADPEVVGQGWFAAACEAWDVDGRLAPGEGSGLGSAPVLLFRGKLDPFSATPTDIETGSGSSTVHLVEVPNGSANVLGGFECVRSIRNAWVNDPTGEPGDTSCLASIPPIDLPD